MKRISDEYLVWLRELYTTESPSRRKAIELIDNIIEERKQQKAWTDAPDNAIIAKVHYYKSDKVYADSSMSCHVYTRDLPKSPIREIAEKYSDKYLDDDHSPKLVKFIESAIKEAMALNK